MKKILFTAAIITIAFTACKKSKVEEPAPVPIPKYIGLWKGTYSNAGGGIIGDVIHYYKNDGTVRVFNGSDTSTATVKGVGIWKFMPGNEIHSEYTYTGSPSNFFSTKIGPDTDYTVTVFGRWGTGKIISSPNTFVDVSLISLRKQ
jgi:hypothetical protein